MHQLKIGSIAIPYVAAFGTGVLLGKLAPPSLLLPLFFAAIACVVVLLLAAHRFDTPVQWGRSRTVAFVLLALSFGPPIVNARSGLMPKLLVMSLLSVLGFVLVLAAQ